MRQARAVELLQVIKAEPNPSVAWGKLNDELLRDLYPDYPPALDYKATLETLVKAWEAYQRGLGYEKQDTGRSRITLLRAAINEYKQSLDLLLGFTIDLSHMEINNTVLQSQLNSARSLLRNLLLEQANKAMKNEQYDTAEKIAKEGESEFPEVLRFAEILREIREKRQQVKPLLIQARAYLEIREGSEREESGIEEAKRAILTAETLLSDALALDRFRHLPTQQGDQPWERVG